MNINKFSDNYNNVCQTGSSTQWDTPLATNPDSSWLTDGQFSINACKFLVFFFHALIYEVSYLFSHLLFFSIKVEHGEPKSSL